MPGAGGNFLARVCEQSHYPAQIIHEAQYIAQYIEASPRAGSGPKRYHNWINFEERWRPTRYSHGHSVHPRRLPWLRVTVTTPAEWHWACANALWKQSVVASHNLASDPNLPAEHHIPLSDLWTWDSISAALAHLQAEPVNAHQRTLYDQWCGTHCPYTDSKQWQRICEHQWGDLQPEYCR